jgi:hypothetical protein
MPRRKSPAFKKLYHGTSREACALIWARGIENEPATRHEPGDFGMGLYLTSDVARARSYGACLLEFLVDTRHFAGIANPYFFVGGRAIWPTTRPERVFYSVVFDSLGRMKTVDKAYSIADRTRASARAREVMLAAGFSGILTRYQGDAVVFDLSTVRTMTELS